MHASSESSPAPEGEQQFSVLLFAGLRDAMKRDEIKVSIPRSENAPGEGTFTVADLLAACAAEFPALADWLPHVRVAVNCEYCNSTARVQSTDEIAFIPPVAGG